MTTKKKKTAAEWRKRIREEIPFVDVRPYSHNIICLALGAIAKESGHDAADQVIIELGLNHMGWSTAAEDRAHAEDREVEK